MNHFMIDIETLGTAPGSVITSIGAVRFDPDGDTLGSSMQVHVRAESCVQSGMQIDAGTVLWWLGQSDIAREAFVHGQRATAVVLPQALALLYEWLHTSAGEPVVWGNGATFDIVMLEDAYRRCHMTPRWKYRNVRCYRTVLAEFGIESDWVKPEVAHDALSDAVAQAKTLQNVYRRMRNG